MSISSDLMGYGIPFGPAGYLQTALTKGFTLTGDSLIKVNTSDAADNKSLFLCGGGSNADTRGAYIQLSGNEEGSTPGTISFVLGNVGGYFDFLMRTNSTGFRIQSQAIGGTIWTFSNSTGELNQNGTNGGPITFNRTGKFVSVKSGANCCSGTAVLVAGAVTVSNTVVTANSSIIHWRQVTGGTTGQLSIGTVTPATSFVINSSSGTDTSTIGWLIVERI